MINMLTVRPTDHLSSRPAVAATLTALRGMRARAAGNDESVEFADYTPQTRVQLAAKRTMDIVLVLLATPAVLPVMVVLAVLVKLTSGGPVLFKHSRVGRDGELFKVLKFRTMVPGTHERIWSDLKKIDEFAASGFKLDARDPAITKVGRFLRRTSLDELPQLFNVLGGSMSLVGVRPLVVPEVTMRSEFDQALYTSMKPGVTGLWQTNGRSAVDGETRVELDRRYLLEWSLLSDVSILLKTPIALLRVHHAA